MMGDAEHDWASQYKVEKIEGTGTSSEEGVSDGSTNSKPKKREKSVLCTSETFKGLPGLWPELRRLQEFCDLTLVSSDGKRFVCHKIVLASQSEFFRKLFQFDPKKTIQMKTFDGKALSVLIDFAYTGTARLCPRNSMSLLRLSDMVQMTDMMEMCIKNIKPRIYPFNCIDAYRFTQQLSCFDLRDYARTYTLKHFKELMKRNKEFQTLEFDELLEFLSDDWLNLEEEDVFGAVRDWVEFDEDQRAQFVEQLLKCVRFGLMDPLFMFDEVLHWHLLYDNPSLMEPMREIYKTIESKLPLTHELCHPRIPHDIIFIIYGWSEAHPTSYIETYDFRSDSWFTTTQAQEISPRGYHFVAVVDNLVYMVGGFDSNKHFNLVACFDPATLTWTQKSVMNIYRCYITGCAIGRTIYAVGGYNNTGRLSSVERYDVDKNYWTMIASMNQQRSDACAVAFKDKVYVGGGYDGDVILNTFEFYDPAQEPNAVWTFLPSFKIPRSGLSLVVYHNNFYVIGGYNGYHRVGMCENFRPKRDTEWVPIADMPTPRSNFQSIVLDDKIFTIGGYDGRGTTPIVEYYERQSDTWTRSNNLNVHRSAFGACRISGIPNIRDFSYMARFEEMYED